MKKKYIRPEMTVYEIESGAILAGSGEDEDEKNFDFGGGDENENGEEIAG